jgi:hypothetical protein
MIKSYKIYCDRYGGRLSGMLLARSLEKAISFFIKDVSRIFKLKNSDAIQNYPALKVLMPHLKGLPKCGDYYVPWLSSLACTATSCKKKVTFSMPREWITQGKYNY